MKIAALEAEGFGALRRISLALDGKSAVILGGNEAGKTALVDAVSCALYGAPRANTVTGRAYATRYGDGFSASASLLMPDGGARRVSSAEPLKDETQPYELFRSLLVIREGECRLPERDKLFMESFSAKVLGAGSANIREAMKTLKRVYAPDDRHRWSHARRDMQEAVERSASALQNAAELEKATARRNDLAAKLAELDGDAAALEARRRELALAGDRQRLERLKNTQARLAQTQRSLDALRGLDRSLFTRIQLMQTELDAAEKSASERRAVSSRLLKNIEDTALELSQTDKLISAIDDASRRQRLRAACEELLALERQTPPALAALRRAAPALLALLTALTLDLALHGRFGAAAALGVAALAAAAVYFAAMVLLPRENYATLRRAADAKTEYEKARAALHRSWLELEPAAALDRLEREAEGEARLRERRAVTAQLLARYREERQLEEEALAEHGRNAARLRRELETGLSPFGAKDLSELRASVEKLEFLRTERQELRRSAQAEADIKPDSFDTDLEKTIRAMERELADLPPEPTPQGPQENARQAQRAAEELKQLQRRRLELSAQLMHESEGLARLEGALGMPAADAYLLARENQSRLQDLELWARAAEEAFQVLAGLANANEETLKNCVENAGPLFSAMTGGKYLGLRLEENSPLEPGALFARHEQLGEKPLEWLSAGAQDLAWMAMRMEFASSGWREPSFMLLDEPFMALDPARAELALRALSTGPLSKWQFILLTKSPDCADACVRAGMKLFKLEPAPQETA